MPAPTPMSPVPAEKYGLPIDAVSARASRRERAGVLWSELTAPIIASKNGMAGRSRGCEPARRQLAQSCLLPSPMVRRLRLPRPPGSLRRRLRRAPPSDIAQLFYSFFKTLIGREIVVELKNDVCIRGTLHSVDQFLNIKLHDIKVTDEAKYPHMVRILPSNL